MQQLLYLRSCRASRSTQVKHTKLSLAHNCAELIIWPTFLPCCLLPSALGMMGFQAPVAALSASGLDAKPVPVTILPGMTLYIMV